MNKVRFENRVFDTLYAKENLNKPLRNSVYKNCVFAGWNFGVDWHGIVFQNCRFLNCDLYGSIIDSCTFDNTDFVNTTIAKSVVTNSQFHSHTFKHSDMQKCAFSECDFVDVAMYSSCKLWDMKFHRCNLEPNHVHTLRKLFNCTIKP